jgi:hypothetical protein
MNYDGKKELDNMKIMTMMMMAMAMIVIIRWW